VSRVAVLLDRDGTLIRDFHFMGKPEQVTLVPGAAAALARINASGLLAIVVTNQSGVARGLFSMADYGRVARRLDEVLAAEGARIDDTYMCPHHPDFSGPCECRKPGTLLFRQAADTHGIDLAQSWYLGDKLRDVLPARELGGRGILIPNGETPTPDVERARQELSVARTLDEAVGRIVESAR
jgi:D-glycero-D-manno-heptose 1,7-bisphosphate phosphatase